MKNTIRNSSNSSNSITTHYANQALTHTASEFIKNLYLVNNNVILDHSTILSINDVPRKDIYGKVLTREMRKDVILETMVAIRKIHAHYHERQIEGLQHIFQQEFKHSHSRSNKKLSWQKLGLLSIGTYLSTPGILSNIPSQNPLSINRLDNALTTQYGLSQSQSNFIPENEVKHRDTRSIGFGDIRPLVPPHIKNYGAFNKVRLETFGKAAQPFTAITETIIKVGGFEGEIADKVTAFVKTAESFAVATIPGGIQFQMVTYLFKVSAELMEDDVSPEKKLQLLEEGQTFFGALRHTLSNPKSVLYPDQKIIPGSGRPGNKNYDALFRAEGKGNIPVVLNPKTKKWEVPDLRQEYGVNILPHNQILRERAGIINTVNNQYVNVFQNEKSFLALFKTNQFGEMVMYKGGSDYVPIIYNSVLRRWEPKITNDMTLSFFSRITNEELIKDAGIRPSRSDSRTSNDDHTFTMGSRHFIEGDEYVYPVQWSRQFNGYVVNVEKEGLTISVPVKFNTKQNSWKATYVKKIEAAGKDDAAAESSNPQTIKTENTIALVSTSINYANPTTITIPLKGIRVKSGLTPSLYSVVMDGYTKPVQFDANYNVWQRGNDPILLKEDGQWQVDTLEKCMAQSRINMLSEDTKIIDLPAIKLIPTNAMPIPKDVYYFWAGKHMPEHNQKIILANAEMCWDASTNTGYRTTLMVDPGTPEVLTELVNNIGSTFPHVKVKDIRQEPFFKEYQKTEDYKFYMAIKNGKGGSKAAEADKIRIQIIKNNGGIYMDVDDTIEAPVAHVELLATPRDILFGNPVSNERMGVTNVFNNDVWASHPGNPVLDAVSEESNARFSKDMSMFDRPRPFIGKNPSAEETAAMDIYSRQIWDTTGPGPLNTVAIKEKPYLNDLNMLNANNEVWKSITPPDEFIRQLTVSFDDHVPFFRKFPVETGSDHSWEYSR